MTSASVYHEIRDPVHVFINVDTAEREVIDSRPVQRLRHVHQLALQYLVYPGATHKRFEHALGVMELASKVYDTITRGDHVLGSIRDQLPELSNNDQMGYWRRVLRMAALCHDIGHLPFSHAAEHDLLPEGWTHELLTNSLLRSDLMQNIWRSIRPPLDVDDVAKLAVGKEKLPDANFSLWEEVLSEIIVGDAFGVDRMDYLLRDSLHAGVQYGRFDHHRLVDTLRILPKSDESEQSGEPTLGLEIGGLHSAEAMLLARYSMFAQLYLHPVRRAYDKHLIEFLSGWLPEGRFPIDPQEFINFTDIEVLASIADSARSGATDAWSMAAKRIAERNHFKIIYSGNAADRAVNLQPGKAVYSALVREFGSSNVTLDNYVPSGSVVDFPILERDHRIQSSLNASRVLGNMPTADIDFVFVESTIRDQARRWINDRLQRILEETDSTPNEEGNQQC